MAADTQTPTTRQPLTIERSVSGGPAAATPAKFSMAEIILGSLVCIILDIIAAIGDVFSFSILGDLVQWGSWLVFTFWFTIKGCKATSSLAKRYIIPMIVQMIPIIPTLIFTFLITVYMENHPEKFAALEKLDGVGKKIPGK